MRRPFLVPSLLIVSWLVFLLPARAQNIRTVAGGFVGDRAFATQASLQEPTFAVQDFAGNLYVSDFSAHRIRKILANGKITTIAGTGISGFSGDNGPATSAMLSFPAGLAMDASGNLFIADSGNNRIRKISSAGIIKTIAGTGAAGYSGDNGPALQATFNQPYGLALDSHGNLFISDMGNSVVRKIDTAHIITTFAGTGVAGYGGDNGQATQAMLNFPRGLALDSVGRLFIADTTNHRVRKVDSLGVIITFAGNGDDGFSGDGGSPTSAAIGNPSGVAISPGGGILYISNAGNARIRTVTGGVINTLAGSTYGFDGDNQPLLSSRFATPSGIFLNRSGNLVVADTYNGRLRTLTGGVVKTTAGGFLGDGAAATAASLVLPQSMAFDTAGNYYIADAGGNRIRKVDTAGNISTVAGTGISGYSGDNGAATAATLNYPVGIAVDSAGNIFVADNGNAVIRKIDTAGTITTFATDSGFMDLAGLAVDSAGNLYSVDQTGCVVRKITPDATVTVVAGKFAACGYNGDGIAATNAKLNMPFGIALEANGNLLIADAGNNRVRKVSAGGIIATAAGIGTCGFSGDNGPPPQAELCSPFGVAADAQDNFYIADRANRRIRKVASATITTVAGTGLAGFNGDNLPDLGANLDDVVAVAVQGAKIFIVDDVTTRVRRIR